MIKYKKNKKLKLISFGIITGFLGIVASGAIVNNNKFVAVKAENENIIVNDENKLYTYLEYARQNNLFTAQGNNIEKLDLSYELYFNSSNYEEGQYIRVRGTYTDYNTQNLQDGYAFYYQSGQTAQKILSLTANGLYNQEATATLQGGITINQTGTNETFYNYVVQQENTPPQPTATDIGTGIISAIRSGLGLITSLATEFMLGFSTLFWNSTTSTLTTFGIFALIMLGVGISFAVIKLVLNILRSNTGA